MQNQTKSLEEAGLKDLSSFSTKETLLCNKLSSPPTMMISNTITTTLFPTINGDDYIGHESCIDLRNENDVVIDNCEASKSNDEDDDPEPTNQANNNVKNSGRRRNMEKRVFPPPIPSLARTENLACHMSWVLRRYYTKEGRLILKEEKVRYHEYFRAHRENGRLTLQLVPLDDDNEDEVEEPCTSSYDEENHHDESKIINNSRFGEDEEEDEEEEKSSNNIHHVESDNVRTKCMNCSSVRTSAAPSCFFGVQCVR